MKTKYLVFPDEQTFTQACEDASLTSIDEEGNTNILTSSHNHVMRVKGIVTEVIEPAESDEDGNVTKEAVTETLEGYHINWKARNNSVPEAFQQHVIADPKTPFEVFAGEQ